MAAEIKSKPAHIEVRFRGEGMPKLTPYKLNFKLYWTSAGSGPRPRNVIFSIVSVASWLFAVVVWKTCKLGDWRPTGHGEGPGADVLQLSLGFFEIL